MVSNSGLYWHVHHDRLFEYCWHAKERIAYIKRNKPRDEIPTRLRLMRPLIGTLGAPKAWAACRKAMVTYGKTWTALSEASSPCSKALVPFSKAWVAYREASAAHDKAWAAWLATIKPGEAKALHAKKCPNCQWNGKTIFPKRRSNGSFTLSPQY